MVTYNPGGGGVGVGVAVIGAVSVSVICTVGVSVICTVAVMVSCGDGVPAVAVMGEVVTSRGVGDANELKYGKKVGVALEPGLILRMPVDHAPTNAVMPHNNKSRAAHPPYNSVLFPPRARDCNCGAATALPALGVG